MDVAAFGSLALGIVVGYLVLRFVRRFSSFAPKSLSAVIGVIAGGSAVQFIAQNPETIWYYPIGVLIGFVIYVVLAFVILGKRDDDDDDAGGGGTGGGGGVDNNSSGSGGGGKSSGLGGLGDVVLTPPWKPH